MFNKKDLRRELEAEKEDELIDVIFDQDNSEIINKNFKEIIEPIVFVGKEKYNVPGLNELPSQITSNYNLFVTRNIDELLNHLDKNSITDLEFNSLQTATDQALYNIIQNTFFNFCSVIDSMNYPLLDYFPIKQFVHDSLNIVSSNIRIMVSQFIAGDNAPTSLKFNDEDINNMSTFRQLVAGQIANYIFGIICFSVDGAINDILLQVHLVPNIDRIYTQLYNDSEFIRKNWNNKKKFDSNYGELAAISLKNTIRQELDNNLYEMIIKSTDYILHNSTLSLYYIFGDFKELNSKIRNNKNDKE